MPAIQGPSYFGCFFDHGSGFWLWKCAVHYQAQKEARSSKPFPHGEDTPWLDRPYR